MKSTKLFLPSLAFLFCLSAQVFAANQTFTESNINDPAAWNTLNNSAGSTGTITGNFVFTSSKAITANNITITSSDNNWKTLTSEVSQRFFTVNSGNTLTLNNIVLNRGTYMDINTSGGGAIASTGTGGLTINGKFAIERSSSVHLGGGVYVEQGTLTINGSASFIMNNAQSGNGGAIFVADNVVFGAGSNLNLQSNYAGLHGGGIYAQWGSVTISGSADISSNTAKSGNGGGIYAGNGAYFTDAGSVILISSNSSLDMGGGVYSGKDIVFSGGANIIKNSAMHDSSTSTFRRGGGLYAETTITFTSNTATIYLQNNVARESGGAIFSKSTVTFAGSANITANQVETSSGGAIWSAGSINFTNPAGNAEIASNLAVEGDGGAFFSENNINFGGYVKATGNSASSSHGGAFYSRALNISDGAEISNNSAGLTGGAVFIHDGISGFNALNRDILFSNNVASGTKNDVNLGGNATLNLTAAAGTITFNGGFSYTSGTANNIVNKYGYGTMHLNGISKFQNVNFTSGTTVLGSGSTFQAVNFSLTGANSNVGTAPTTVLDMRNGNLNDNLLITGILQSTTAAKIYYDIDSNTNASDKISANTAYMNGTWIKVGVAGIDADQKVYNIFNSTAGYGTMRIDNTNVQGNPMNRVHSYLTYSNGVYTSTTAPAMWESVNLVLSIDQLNVINGLTENQKKVALAMDKEYGTAVDDLFYIIDKIDTLPDTASQKKALTSLSGHIFANVITVPALNVSKDNVLSRLKKSYFIPDDSLIKRNIWAQTYASDNKYKGDKNSPGDFDASNVGVQAGFDTMKDDIQIFGLSVGYTDSSSKQNSDTVDIKGYNIGGYGAFFFENNLELKLMVVGGRQNYSSSRKIAYDVINRHAGADFDGYSINTAAELGYDYFYKNNIYFRPSVGLDYSYVTTQEFTEKGANSADLSIYAGSYNRVNSNFGFQVNNGTDMRAKWYAETKFNFLLAGRYGEFEGEFKNTGQPLSIVGIESDMFAATIGAGVLYDISKNWSAYANVNGLFSGTNTGLYGNIGVNYKFTTTYFDFYER